MDLHTKMCSYREQKTPEDGEVTLARTEGFMA